MKLAPVTVRVKAGPPAVAEVGLMLASTGAGLLIAKDTPPKCHPRGQD